MRNTLRFILAFVLVLIVLPTSSDKAIAIEYPYLTHLLLPLEEYTSNGIDFFPSDYTYVTLNDADIPIIEGKKTVGTAGNLRVDGGVLLIDIAITAPRQQTNYLAVAYRPGPIGLQGTTLTFLSVQVTDRTDDPFGEAYLP